MDDLRSVVRNPASLRRRHARQVLAVVYGWLTLPLLRFELDRRARAPHQGLRTLLPVETIQD
jgi:hypothetical protein